MLPRVDADGLAGRLRPPGFWCSVATTPATGSTNADLLAAARAGAASGTALVADHQSAGRGRHDRSWTAPPGAALAISALLRPTPSVPAQRWTWLPLLAGLAVSDGLRAATGIETRLKWPNDVLIEDRKVCGILAERADGTGLDPAVVIGAGINTDLTEADLPVPTATSLALAGAAVDPELVAAEVLSALAGWYQRWLAGEDLRPDYRQRCGTIGRSVRVELAASRADRGLATGVDADGRLLVRVAGRELAYAAGDVVHLR